MQLTKWEPLGELDRFFDEFPRSKFGWDLAVDVYEKDNNVIAEMSLPGVDPEKVDISVDDNYLRISGSREESKEEKDRHYYRQEIHRGSFDRTVRLPQSVDKNSTKAECKNGNLIITMPKIETEGSGRVKVPITK